MPIKYPCTVCKLSVRNTHKAILCDICQNWTHLSALLLHVRNALLYLILTKIGSAGLSCHSISI